MQSPTICRRVHTDTAFSMSVRRASARAVCGFLRARDRYRVKREVTLSAILSSCTRYLVVHRLRTSNYSTPFHCIRWPLRTGVLKKLERGGGGTKSWRDGGAKSWRGRGGGAERHPSCHPSLRKERVRCGKAHWCVREGRLCHRSSDRHCAGGEGIPRERAVRRQGL